MNPWLAFLIGLWIGGFVGICAVALAQSSKRAEDWGQRLTEWDGSYMTDEWDGPYDHELEGAERIAPNVVVKRR